MKVVFHCTEEQQKEIKTKPTNADVNLVFIINNQQAFDNEVGDVFFDLLAEEVTSINKDGFVFFSAVNETITGKNRANINAWPGFLQRSIVEVATEEAAKEAVATIMNTLGWKFQFVPNEVGMIAPRIIAMIVNEAYFGLADEISTKEEIDTAMKLGTNYPYGPFEWSEKIGLKRIAALLEMLAMQDERYTPSSLLIKEAHGVTA